jgi:PAS domain S-box-containing protein
VSRTEDRAETDQTFSHLEATFRALVEQIPAIVYVWAVRGGTDDIVDEYVSPQIEAILGFRPDEWTNDPSLWVRRLHEDDRKDVLAEASRSVDAGEPFRMEYRMVAKDGRVVWLSDRAAVLARDEAGRAVRYQGVQLDVTARKDAEHAQRRNIDQLRRLDQDRRQLMERIASTQEEERRRIAEGILEDTMRGLFALPLTLETLSRRHAEIDADRRIPQLRDDVTNLIGRLRRLAFELHPKVLDADGLAPALRALQEMWQADGQMGFELRSRLSSEPSSAVRAALFRLAQEALANARRHSGATHVVVSLRRRGGGVVVEIDDDGSGFDVDSPDVSTPAHFGLSSMRERAEAAGGWCRIESHPGTGTNVKAWIPDPPNEGRREGRVEASSQDPSGDIAQTDRALASRGLTSREIDVARFLAAGNTNAEIAAILFLSVRTVEHHRSNLFRKLGVHSRAGLVQEIRSARNDPPRENAPHEGAH